MSPTVDTYLQMDDELTARLFDAGFAVEVDFTPLANGESPAVIIHERIMPFGGFDHEEKQHEVKKIRESGDDVEEIESAGPSIDPIKIEGN